MAEIKPYMPFLNAADVGGECGASTDNSGNIEVVAMQHQAVGPYYCNMYNLGQNYYQQQQQPLPVQQQTEFPHTNILPYYSAMQSPYQVPGGGGPNVNIYQQPPPPVQQQQQQQQHSPQNATTHMSIVTQQPSPLYQEHHVSASNRISIQPDLVPINPVITPQLQQPLPSTQSYQELQQVSEFVPLNLRMKYQTTLGNDGSPMIEIEVEILTTDNSDSSGNRLNSCNDEPTQHVLTADGQILHGHSSSQHELVSTTGELNDISVGNNANVIKKAISTTKKGPGRPAMKCRRSYPTCSINPRTVRLPNGRIKCMECDKDFTKPCYLTQHINSLHSGDYPYRCIKCGKRYKTTESYEVHISRHGSTEKREKCNQCSKQFCHKSDLKRHVSIKHTGDKQHICEVCSKSFSRADHLHKHKGVHSKHKRVPKKMIGKDSVGQKTDEKVNVETKSNEANENGEMGASLIDLIDEYLLKMDDIDCNNRTDNDDFSISEFLKPYLAY